MLYNKFINYEILIMRAFSLIELMVVVAIIAILAAIAVPSYNKYTQRVKIDSAYSYLANELVRLKTLVSAGSQAQINNASNYLFIDNTALSQIPKNPNPYIAHLTEGASGPQGGYCATAYTSAQLTNFDGLGNANVTNNGSLQIITLRVFDVNGTYIETCVGYTLAWPAYTYITGLMPQGCYDQGDANQSAAYVAFVNNVNSTSSCQIIQ